MLLGMMDEGDGGEAFAAQAAKVAAAATTTAESVRIIGRSFARIPLMEAERQCLPIRSTAEVAAVQMAAQTQGTSDHARC
jgi:hypothetical protein